MTHINNIKHYFDRFAKMVVVKSLRFLKNINIFFYSIFHTIFQPLYYKGNLQVKLIKRSLDKLEKIPVYFSGREISANVQRILKIADKILEEQDNTLFNVSVLALKWRVIALKYRLEEQNGGIDQADVVDPAHFEFLKKAIIDWKEKHFHMRVKKLTERDVIVCHKTCFYPLFVELLKEDENFLHRFFVWTIQDINSVDLFILYPALERKFERIDISQRIGAAGGHILKVQKWFDPTTHTLKKIVTMLMEGREINILDEENVVVLSGRLSLKIKEIFKIFENKKRYIGDVEITKDGVINWNSNECARWNTLRKKYQYFDVLAKKWWEELPVFKTLTVEEVQEEYSSSLNGLNWAAVVKASRERPTLDTLGTHAFLEILIPINDGSEYAIYPFGKCAKGFNVDFSAFEGFNVLGAFFLGTIAYIDENVYYTHRDIAKYVIPLSVEDGKKLMEIIKVDFIQSRNNNLAYQIETENCAKWIDLVLDELMGSENFPNLFKISYLDVEPSSLGGVYFKFLKLFPESWQPWILTRSHLPLGAMRGMWITNERGQKQWVSLQTLPFWEDVKIHLPALLHKQQEKGHCGETHIYGDEDRDEVA